MGITGVGADNGFWNNILQNNSKAGKGAADKNRDNDYTKEEMLQIISERMEEIYEKVKNNDTETSFQIGSQSFTMKEWDRILEQFDAIQEEIREQMREEQAKRQEEKTTKVTVETAVSVTSEDSTNIAKAASVAMPDASRTADGDTETETVMASLVTESTTCTYPATDEKDSDEMYITWYTNEGIFCRKAGQTEGYLWSLPLESSAQYESVLGFLNQVNADADYRFAAKESFWRDFLNGQVDTEDFADLLNGVKGEVAGDTYAKYMD